VQSVSWSIDVTFPSPFSEMMSVLSFFSFDFLSLECLFKKSNHFLSVYLWSSVPLCLAAMLVVVHFTRRAFWPSTDQMVTSTRNENLATRLLLLGYLVLPSVSLKQLQALDCVAIEEKHYLRIDTSIDCDSKEYKLFRVVDGLFIAAYLATPLLWFALLAAHRDSLDPAPSSGSDKTLALFVRDQDPTLRPLRFLFGAYRPSMFYMEVVEM
jgi:hypothetical protein